MLKACMRMRKLGNGQSVIFCVSPEMQHKIRALLHVPNDQKLTVSDILTWSIFETWDETLRSIPLWATQGVRHQRQSVIWDRAHTNDGPLFSKSDIDDYLDDEAQTLEQRYGLDAAHVHIDDVLLNNTTAKTLASRAGELREIKRGCEMFGVRSLGSATLQEEQERELATEVEEERQVERPAPAEPERHSIHEDVRRFISTGVISLPSDGITPAFQALSATTAARLFDLSNFDRHPQEVLATADFARTVQQRALFCADAYQRPVQWVLAGSAADTVGAPTQLVVLSPWEANVLLPSILASGKTTLHLYSPRSSLSFRSLEDLTSFTLPAVPRSWTAPRLAITQLNLFAGQTYLRSYEEYVQLCNYLGISHRENTGNEAIPVDGFTGARAGNSDCKFTSSPIPFLNVLYKRIRADCLDIGQTHVGKILAGDILAQDEF